MKTKFTITPFLVLCFSLFIQAQDVSFVADQLSGCYPLTVTFTNTSTVGVKYKWYIYPSTDSTRDLVHTFTEAGDYTVQLYAYDAGGHEIGNFYKIIDIEGAYDDFQMSEGTACIGKDLTFSAYEPQGNYLWYFGDDSSATSAIAHHSYSSTGNYNVQLIVNSACGTDTTTKQVIITDNLQPAVLGFYILPSITYYSRNKVCPDELVNFYVFNSNLDSDVDLRWDFGDGTTLSGVTISPWHSYSALGTYLVTLSVHNSCGRSSSYTDTIFVVDTSSVPPPRFNAAPVPGCSSKQFNFSYYQDFPSRLWNFGDGATDTSFSPRHTFATTGSYIVSLSVTNNCGISGFYKDTIEVMDTIAHPGVPSFVIITDSICPGTPLRTFSYYYGSNETTSVLWDFGDGETDTAANPSHSYINPGNYTVTKTVTGACGSSSLYTQPLVVGQSVKPFAPYFDVTEACPGDTVRFETFIYIPNTFGLTVPYNADALYWDFGDGTIDTIYGYQAQHAYAQPGRYEVTVTAVNQCAESNSFSASMVIANNIAPDAYFGWAYQQNGLNHTCENIEFNATNGWMHVRLSDIYEWDFGDGTTITTTSTSVHHAYNIPGNYTITLMASNGCGHQERYDRAITIDGNCVTADIEENGAAEENAVRIFPNPFSDFTTIQVMGENQPVKYELDIFDLFGRMVHHQALTSRQQTLTLNQPAGIYFYRLTSGDNSISTGKIIKQ